MTALTLEITPELESALQQEAARLGVDTQAFVLHSLQESLGSMIRSARAKVLSAEETALLQEINQGLPSEIWRRYDELKARRDEAELTPAEHREIIAISDRIEDMNVHRMESVLELARLRKVTVESLVKDLGLESPLRA